jgi:glycosyltransferase 2 family protein
LEQNQSGKEKKSIPWVRILGTLAALGLLVYLVLSQGWQALLDSLEQVSWPGFLLATALIFGSRFSTVGRWHVLLRSADVPIRLRQSLELVFAGLFSANFLPTTVGGDLVRLAGAVRWGYDGAVVAASLVMDRLVGMAGMATVLPFGLASFLSQPLPLPKSTSPAGPALAAGLPGRAGPWVREKLGMLWESLRRAARLWLSRPRQLFYAYLFTWGHMLFTFLTTWFLFQVMGEPVPFTLVAGLWSMSYFITLLPISINGLGVQELSISFFFTNYAHVSIHSALVLAIIMRAVPLLCSLPGALFVPGLLSTRKESKETS